MKKIIAALVLAAAALSCVSAKKTIKDKIDQVKIGKFKEADIDEGDFRMKKTLTKNLYVNDYTVKLYSEDGSTGIYYKTDLASKESLRFDKDARDALRSACDQYLSDYENKKLKKSKKFTSAYGTARTKIVWKMISESATANPKIEFGYTFVGKSPYFCIKINQTNAEEKKGDIIVQYIGSMMYFTRAQLKELVAAMDENKIQETYLAATAVKELPEDSDYDDTADYEEASDDDAEKSSDSKKSKKNKKAEEAANADYSEAE